MHQVIALAVLATLISLILAAPLRSIAAVSDSTGVTHNGGLTSTTPIIIVDAIGTHKRPGLVTIFPRDSNIKSKSNDASDNAKRGGFMALDDPHTDFFRVRPGVRQVEDEHVHPNIGPSVVPEPLPPIYTRPEESPFYGDERKSLRKEGGFLAMTDPSENPGLDHFLSFDETIQGPKIEVFKKRDWLSSLGNAVVSAFTTSAPTAFAKAVLPEDKQKRSLQLVDAHSKTTEHKTKTIVNLGWGGW